MEGGEGGEGGGREGQLHQQEQVPHPKQQEPPLPGQQFAPEEMYAEIREVLQV
jgi:hypothetical protein